MTREIRFRAWDIQHETWHEFTLDGLIRGYAVPLDAYKWWREFTGLTDKNGVDIYEGDIVKCFYPQEVKIMEVIFNQDTVSFEFRGEEVYDSLVNAGNFEVIGNVHEHPELLS
jgi:hypothetical protein